MCLCETPWAQDVNDTFRSRSMTNYGRLVRFQHKPCVVGVRFLRYFYLCC